MKKVGRVEKGFKEVGCMEERVKEKGFMKKGVKEKGCVEEGVHLLTERKPGIHARSRQRLADCFGNWLKDLRVDALIMNKNNSKHKLFYSPNKRSSFTHWIVSRQA